MRLKFSYASGGAHPTGGEVLYPIQTISDSEEQGRYQRYLADVLGAVAKRPAHCDQLLAMISSIEKGEQQLAEYDANEVELKISEGGVQADILVNPEWTGTREGLISLNVWRVALQASKSFLELPPAISSSIEVELPSE